MWAVVRDLTQASPLPGTPLPRRSPGWGKSSFEKEKKPTLSASKPDTNQRCASGTLGEVRRTHSIPRGRSRTGVGGQQVPTLCDPREDLRAYPDAMYSRENIKRPSAGRSPTKCSTPLAELPLLRALSAESGPAVTGVTRGHGCGAGRWGGRGPEAGTHTFP